MEFTITSSQILGTCGLLTSLWAVYKIYKEIKKPNEDIKNKVAEHEKKLSEVSNQLKYLEDATKLILDTQLVMVEHDITKNGYPKLEESRDKIHKFLIEE